MAWTEKLPSGRYVARYRVGGKVKSAGTYTRQKEALIEAQNTEARARGFGEFTWTQWWEVWSTEHLEEGRLPATVEQHKRIERLYVGPKWGDTLLTNIYPEDVAEWARRLRSKHSYSYTSSIVNTLRVALEAAVIAKKVPMNPVRGLKIRGEDLVEADENLQFLSEIQAKTVREKLRTVEDKAVFDTLLGTGLRIGELAGLCWGDIDFAEKVVRVRRSYSRGKHQYGPTKNRKSRVVPLTPELAKMLELRHAVMGDGQPNPKVSAHIVPKPRMGPVFLSPEGWPLNAHGYLGRLQSAGLAAKLDFQVTCHMIRHTYASWLVQRGVSLHQVQKLLGHSNLSTTQRYAHLADTLYDEVRMALGSGKTD